MSSIDETESQDLDKRIAEHNSKMSNSAMIGSVEPLTEKDNNWTLWAEMLENYFDANSITDEKKKASIFLTVLGKYGYELISTLCNPEKPKSKNYEKLIKLMGDHLQPLPSEITERYNFRKCKQGEDSVKTFIANLKKLATYCNFGTQLNKHLRDQFVCGVKNSSTREKLLRSGAELTFDKAVEIALSMETSHRDAAEMQQQQQTSTSVNFIRKQQSKSRPARFGKGGHQNNSGGGSTSNSKNGCKCCGKPHHVKTQCFYREYVCEV